MKNLVAPAANGPPKTPLKSALHSFGRAVIQRYGSIPENDLTGSRLHEAVDACCALTEDPTTADAAELGAMIAFEIDQALADLPVDDSLRLVWQQLSVPFRPAKLP